MDAPTKRQVYYQAHKDDETFKQKNREWRKAYYYRNVEKERTDALNRYYLKKGTTVPPPVDAEPQT
jgi:hypothetical protein